MSTTGMTTDEQPTSSSFLTSSSSSSSLISIASSQSSPISTNQSHLTPIHNQNENTANPNSSKRTTPKLSNTGALLDQYQHDDDLTTNLLHAIRSWNLSKSPQPPSLLPSSSSSSSLIQIIQPLASNDGTLTSQTTFTQSNHDCSSTINSEIGDIDTAFSSMTMASSSTTHGANSSNNTPCKGNYSSRPSGLTARILSMDTSFENNNNNNEEIHAEGMLDNMQHGNDDDEQSSNNKHEKVHLPIHALVDTTTNTDEKNHNIIHQLQEKINQQQQEIDNMKSLLQNVSTTLGLNPENEVDKLLPTVQKLVRVVMIHVPHLEKFVDDVCEVAIDDNDINEENRGDNRNKKPSKRKDLQSRKKKMDKTVQIIKRKLQDKTENDDIKMTTMMMPTPTPQKSRKVLRKVNVTNVNDLSCDNDGNELYGNKMQSVHGDENRHADNQVMVHQEDQYSLSSSLWFRDNVINKIQRSYNDQMISDIETNQDIPEQQAMVIIDSLIEFEQKYRKVKGFNYESQSDSFSGVIQSPPQSQSILRDLFKTDATQLRQFVLHFAYLFSVRQDEIMSKMNDIYVFSHEASTFIENIKTLLGLPSSSPLQSIERKVAEIVNDTSMGNNLNQSQQQQQQRNQHVRFNAVVEEFS